MIETARTERTVQIPLIEVYTIDGSNETFSSYAMATLAATTQVMAKHRSIMIYRNNEPYALKRF